VEENRKILFLASFFHDLGKIIEPKLHEERGRNIFENINLEISEIIYHHHRHDKKDFIDEKKKGDEHVIRVFRNIFREKYCKDRNIEHIFAHISSLIFSDRTISTLEHWGFYTAKTYISFNLSRDLFSIPEILREIDLDNIREIIKHVVVDMDKGLKDIMKCLFLGETDNEDLEKILKLLALTVKETRGPYNDVSLLAHSTLTAALTLPIYDVLNNIDNPPQINVVAITLDFDNYVVNVRRLFEHRGKIYELSGFYGDLITNIIERDIEMACRLFVPPVPFLINSIWKEKSTEELEFYNALGRIILLKSLIYLGTDETKTEKLLKIIEEGLREHDLYDVVTLKISKRSINTSNVFSKIPNNGFKLRKTTFHRELRNALRSTLFHVEEELLQGYGKEVITYTSSEKATRICEICHVREAICDYPYRLCERCKKIFDKYRRGILLDDVADEDSYIAILRLKFNGEKIIMGDIQTPIHKYASLRTAEIPVLWSIDRGLETISKILLRHILLHSELITRLEELERNGKVKAMYHVKARIEKNIDRIVRKYFGFIDIKYDDETYAGLLRKGEAVIEMFGIPENSIILDNIGSSVNVKLSKTGEGELETTLTLLSKRKVDAKDRIPLVIAYHDELVILMPASLSLYVPILFNKYYNVYPLTSFKLKIVPKTYPLYIAFKELRGG